MNSIKKIIIIILLLISTTSITYCAFTTSVIKTGYEIQIRNTKFSTLLSNEELLAKIQKLDNTITSINKSQDLHKVDTLPNITFTDDNLASTEQSIPIYMWIENGTIYYYTIAEVIILNEKLSNI